MLGVAYYEEDFFEGCGRACLGAWSRPGKLSCNGASLASSPGTLVPLPFVPAWLLWSAALFSYIILAIGKVRTCYPMFE